MTGVYYHAITTMRQIVSKCTITNCLQLETLDKLAHLQQKSLYIGPNDQVNNPAVMERIAILWLIIALIICLEREGQATTDPTLRLESRVDHVVNHQKEHQSS